MSTLAEYTRWLHIAAALVAILLAVWGVMACRRSRPRRAGPQCGKCRYLLTGMASARCPECGGEPEVVGVIPAGFARLNAGRVMVFSGTLAVLAMWGMGHLNYPLCVYYEAESHARLRFAAADGGELCLIDLWVRAQGWSAVMPPQTLHAQYEGLGDRGTIDYDFGQRVWAFRSASNAAGGVTSPGFREVRGALSRRDIQNCFSGMGIHPRVADEISVFMTDAAVLKDASTLTARVRLSTHIAYTGISYGGSVTPIRWLYTGPLVPWIALAIWGVGLRFIGIWSGGVLTGEEATRHVCMHAPERVVI